MGSTGLYREKGQSNLDFFAQEVTGGRPEWGELLAGKTVSNVFYGAWKLGSAHGADAGQVTALVVPFRWIRGRQGWASENFIYKAMTEQEGPCDAQCPAEILDLLTWEPTEFATEWRARCRLNAAKPKVKAGDTVRFFQPVTFTNDQTFDTFVYEKGSVFRVDGYRYRISGWKAMGWELVA